MIGRTVSHYRILSALGSGGMGVVYLAEDSRLGRQVALKFLPASWSQEAKALERFRVEARAASSLSHPAICAIYDIGQDGDTPFIVMEALKGETLRERIAKGRLRLNDVLDIGIQLSDALEAAHTQGIVHRDIKPANIFLGDKNRVKVLDFGLAKLMAWSSSLANNTDTTSAADRKPDIQITQPGTALGTVSYMSPEQARGEPVDSRTDLFSLGALLYEMVTGIQAFSGATTAVIYDAILNRPPRPIATLNPLVPPRLESVIATALEKDRELRYQHASELEAELRRIRRDMESGTLITSQSALTAARETARPSAQAAPPADANHRWERPLLVVAFLAVFAAAFIMWRQQGTTNDSARVTPATSPAVAPAQQPAPETTAPPATTPASPVQDTRAAAEAPAPVAPPPRGRVTAPSAPVPNPRSATPAPPPASPSPASPPPAAPAPAALPATQPPPAATQAADAAPATPPPAISTPPPAPAATPPPPAEVAKQPPTASPAAAEAAPQAPAPAQPAPPARAATTPEPTPATASAPESDEAAIRRVIRLYEQAIETKDLALYRSLRPNLPRAAETVLVNSFRQVDSQEVDIRIEALRVEGRTASARLVRRDTLVTGGRRQVQNSTQTLRFEKTGTGWIIAE